jgi:hypothetical protein
MRRLLPLLPLLTACTSYQGARPVEAIPLPAAERERFEVWSHGTGHQLHALRAEGDSIVGVPWWKDPACDSCRVAFARTEIDSIRVRRFDANESGALASLSIPFFVFPMLGLMALYLLGIGPVD